MAKFEGNLEEFSRFIGPLFKNTIAILSRKLKSRSHCQYPGGCDVKRPLDAAHKKGHERTKIIADILQKYENDEDSFSVDLQQIELDFRNAHDPIDEIIIPLCRKHHLEYDGKIAKENFAPIIIQDPVDEDGEPVYPASEIEDTSATELSELRKLMNESDQSRIKREVAERFNASPRSITYSKLSDSSRWNFDIAEEKFGGDVYFIFHDQHWDDYNIAVIPSRSLDISAIRRKGNAVRFVVNTMYIDNSGLSFRPYLRDSHN